MKRVPIVLTIICLLLTACAGAPSPPPIATPRPRPTPRIRNTTYYTKRCWPACYVGYYRLGEGDWVEVSRCINLMMAPTKVGFAVTNGNRDPDIPEIPADFDFFTLVERY